MSSYSSYYNDSDFASPYSNTYLLLHSVILPIFYILISIVGLIANGLVIFCLFYFSNLKTVPNIYILNLAVIDTLFLLSLPFIAYQYIAQDWPFGVVICKFVNGMDTFNQYGSAWTLVAMSADRFVAVAYPLSSMQRRTRSCARLVCGIVIFCSLVLSSVNWYFATAFLHEPHNITLCRLILPEEGGETISVAYTSLNFCFGFAFPLGFIIFFYMSIFYIMQNNDFFFQSDAKTAAQRASKRVAVLTIAVIVVFFICWMPYYSVQLKLLFTDDTSQLSPFIHIFHMFTIALCYLNSVFNPFVYTFVGENFRKNMAKLFLFGTQNLSRARSGRDLSSYTRSTMKLQPLKRNQTKASYCSPTDVTVDGSQETNNNANVTGERKVNTSI